MKRYFDDIWEEETKVEMNNRESDKEISLSSYSRHNFTENSELSFKNKNSKFLHLLQKKKGDIRLKIHKKKEEKKKEKLKEPESNQIISKANFRHTQVQRYKRIS